MVLAHDRGYHGLAGVTTTATRLQPYHAEFGAEAPDVVEVPAPYTYRCPAGVPCEPESCPVCQRKVAGGKNRGAGRRAGWRR